MWDCARPDLRELRDCERARPALLRELRHRPRGHGRACGGIGSGPGRRTAARLRALRRPRRLHDAVGVARRGGGARAPLALLRHVPTADRALRRHRREVHRRCGDGGVGDAGRDGGRCGARRSRGARPRHRRRGARRRARRGESQGARGRAHRRGRRHARRDGSGHGRRRSRQHRFARPVGRRARHRVRRRGDAPRRRADDRLRGRGLVRAQGQGGRDAVVARAACRLRALRALSSRRASRRRSSAATASSGRSRSSSTRPPTRSVRSSCR